MLYLCFRKLKLPTVVAPSLALFRMNIFGAAFGWGWGWWGCVQVSRTYPAMMKLETIIPYLKKINTIHHVTQPLSSGDINILAKSATFVTLRNTNTDCTLNI